MCYDSRSVKFLAEMGCGSSHAVNITDRIADEKASIFGENVIIYMVVYKESGQG